MPPRHDGLFGAIADFQALRRAALSAVRGKRKKPGAAAFMANLERELLRLERELQDGSYRPGKYLEIELHDPKHRIVSAAPFRDRVVHHAVHAVVAPIFERGFIANSFANRDGKGTHRALACYERYRDRHRHVLRCDIFRYFPAIDHEILKRDLTRRIACAPTLHLLAKIVDGSNRQEPVLAYFPGDDLFAPHERRRGLPIGNLTSQFFANLYLDPLDHFVTERLGAPYLRYVDDFALFAPNPATLESWRVEIAAFLEKRRLLLHPRKTFIAEAGEPALFLGFVLQPGGYRRLPEANVARFRNRLRSLRDRWRRGTAGIAEVDARVGAWIAHAAHADTWRLRAAIFRGGRFAPAAGGSLAGSPNAPRRARRLLEQQSEERTPGESQQGRHRKPQQQSGVPRGQHASMPEPARPRPRRASRGCVQGRP